MSESKSVVIVEDDFLIAHYLKQVCEEMGVEVLGMTGSPDEAIELIEREKPEYVLMDVRLGGRRDGVDVAIHVHSSLPDIKIVFVTGSNEPPTLDRIKSDNPYRILIKPIDLAELEQIFA